MIKSISTLLFFSFILAGCANIAERTPITDNILNNEERISKLKALPQWNIQGKIAFLQKNKRESAGFNWRVNQKLSTQQLNLTTYLGINVLSLKQSDTQSIIEVDGETYHSDNLEALILQLTGLTIPTQALHAWIKGLTYLPSDNITYDAKGLPSTLISQYNHRNWQINYQQHRAVASYWLPHKLTIVQGELTIKLQISRWTL